MWPEHLSDEQLTALRDGELSDPAIVEHVSRCVECSARLGDTTLLSILLRRMGSNARPPRRMGSTHAMADAGEHVSGGAPGARPYAGHLGSSLLSAYLAGGLATSERALVDDHLAACSACAARLMRLRGAIGSAATPSAETIDRLRQRYRAPRPRRAGALCVARRGAGFELTWWPPGDGDDWMPTVAPPVAAPRPARSGRRSLWGRLFDSLFRKRSVAEAPAAARVAWGVHGSVLTIGLGSHVVETCVAMRDTTAVLLLRVTERASRRPVARVAVSSETRAIAAEPSYVITDVEGHAEVALPLDGGRISLAFGATEEHVLQVIWT